MLRKKNASKSASGNPPSSITKDVKGEEKFGPRRSNGSKSASGNSPSSIPKDFENPKPSDEEFLTCKRLGFLLGPYPTKIICPHCFQKIKTRIQYTSSASTHFLAILLCLLCCFGWLPYITSCCRNVEHFCPLCDGYIGTYVRNL